MASFCLNFDAWWEMCRLMMKNSEIDYIKTCFSDGREWFLNYIQTFGRNTKLWLAHLTFYDPISNIFRAELECYFICQSRKRQTGCALENEIVIEVNIMIQIYRAAVVWKCANRQRGTSDNSTNGFLFKKGRYAFDIELLILPQNRIARWQTYLMYFNIESSILIFNFSSKIVSQISKLFCCFWSVAIILHRECLKLLMQRIMIVLYHHDSIYSIDQCSWLKHL